MDADKIRAETNAVIVGVAEQAAKACEDAGLQDIMVTVMARAPGTGIYALAGQSSSDDSAGLMQIVQSMIHEGMMAGGAEEVALPNTGALN